MKLWKCKRKLLLQDIPLLDQAEVESWLLEVRAIRLGATQDIIVGSVFGQRVKLELERLAIKSQWRVSWALFWVTAGLFFIGVVQLFRGK